MKNRVVCLVFDFAFFVSAAGEAPDPDHHGKKGKKKQKKKSKKDKKRDKERLKELEHERRKQEIRVVRDTVRTFKSVLSRALLLGLR